MRNKLYSYTQDYVNRWIVSYADFVTMLLALFMVMYALTQMDVNHLKDFSSSVGQAFDKSNAKDYKVNMADMLNQKRDLLRIFSTTEALASLDNIDISDQKQEMLDLKDKIDNVGTQIAKEAVEFENIKSLIKKNIGDSEGLLLSRESRGLIITLKDTVIFDAGSDIIKDKARVTLDRLAGILREIPNSVRIEGHTDNQPIMTSKFPSNWELSTARATNIVRYLVNNHKFSPEKLSAVGYGEYMPVKDNSTEEGRSSNRRVDIVILSSTSKIFEPSSDKVN